MAEIEDNIRELVKLFEDEAFGFSKNAKLSRFRSIAEATIERVEALREESRGHCERADSIADTLPKDVYEGLTVVGSVRLVVVELDGDAQIGLQRHGDALEIWEVNALGLGPAFTSEETGQVENPIRGSIHSLARAAMACAELRERSIPREPDVEASSPNEIAVATEAAEDAAPSEVEAVSGEAPTAEPIENVQSGLDNGENATA